MRNVAQTSSQNGRHALAPAVVVSSIAPDDLGDAFVVPEPIMKHSVHDLNSLLDKHLLKEPTLLSPSPSRWSSRGVRYALPSFEGCGCTDFFKISETLYMSVTDAKYDHDTWINVQGDKFFKVRILLSGTLLRKNGDILAKAPTCSLFVSPSSSRGGYYIAGNEKVHMVVLHCNPEVLTSVVGFEASKVPAPLDRLFLPDQECTSENLGLMPEAMQSARRFAEARHQMNGTLIQSYRECLGMQILIHVLKKLNEYRTRHRDSKLRLRDVDRIHAARDFLMRDYVQPPSIRDLARRVGMNQTKLKVGFREVMRTSIYKFVLQCRMERAADLLKAGKHDIAQVAYEVGYSYPSSFTHAFKKFHGSLPRAFIV